MARRGCFEAERGARTEEACKTNGRMLMERAALVRQVDERVRAAVGRRQGLEAEEIAALLEARRLGVDEALGFGSFHEYAEARLGLSSRMAYERVRVVEALADLPLTQATLAAGGVTYSAVRELSRVMTPANEAAWLAHAGKMSVREIERQVAGLEPGAMPGDEPDPARLERLVRFALTPATYALLCQVRKTMHKEAGAALDDDAFMNQLLRVAAASGDRKPGTPSYQISIGVCDRCERVTQDGGGKVFDIDPKLLEVALCDASVHSPHHPDAPGTRKIPSARRAAALRRAHGCCEVPGCRASVWVDVHHWRFWSRGGDHALRNLIVLCSAHHRAVHDGHLLIHRDPRGDRFAYRHRDGRSYGSAAPAEVERQSA
ncbi:MAG: HNH endonuclease [Deltaproteobacteria bacterium]|nr:HNH endonuclease [Deltaproteobacteria bacterium]